MFIKLLLGTAVVISLWSIAHALQRPQKSNSAPPSAKCLVEVDGVHYIGGVCKFTKIDNLGSFKLLHEQSGLIVQVNVSKKDQGHASWNGPLGQGAGTSLGDVYRTDACWSGDDNHICAWSMNQDVYLGPTPPEPNPTSIIFWGSRVGMFDEIASRKGIDTSNAKITTAPSRDGVIIFCRQYAQTYSNKCIQEGLKDDRPKTATADCKQNTFVDFSGNRFKFLGKNGNTNGDVSADYLIKDPKTGEILNGSTASGYDIEFGIFQALCPAQIGETR